MPDGQVQFVDRDLARRLETAYAWRSVRYARTIDHLWREQKVAVEAVGGGYAVYAGPAFPVNRASGLGLNGPAGEDDLARIEEFYRSRCAAPRIDLCPVADESLLVLLRERGYTVEGFMSVLWRPLPLTPDEFAPVPGVSVTRAGREEAELWLRTVGEGFEGKEAPPETRSILAPNFYGDRAEPFLAWIDGQPAGGGAFVSHEGVAELCSASTRPAFRRRGVQLALLRARLEEAARAGNDVAMAHTAPGSPSQRNVERAGFRLAYTRALLGLPR
ncbi:MAG: GNAT family N-acetyltransferase [Anaerolineae bacterium]|nr:GNAT family N-acetyltransferase [Anaerolineae bacterium]